MARPPSTYEGRTSTGYPTRFAPSMASSTEAAIAPDLQRAPILRAGAAQLSQALSKAELHPGDIVIRDGAPPQPAPARAGHFLDRAL